MLSVQANRGVLDDQQAMKVVNGLAGPISPPSMKGMHQNASPPTSLPSQQQAVMSSGGATSHLHNQQKSGQFPPLGPHKAATYQTAFEQLDTDKDGCVQGVDCFAAFMRSGLPKSTLKSIWDVVAGNEGSLNRHQFIQSLYLIDCAKTGIPIPSSLPAGQFPPTEGNVGLGYLVVGGFLL